MYVLSERALASDSANLLCAGNDTTSSGAKVTYLYQYATLDDWKTAVNDSPDLHDFTSFDKTYWNTGSEPIVPTWK